MDEIMIGDILFTPQKRMINKRGSLIKMRNKESEVLSLLCHNYPDSLTRDDIEKEIWGDSYVTDNTLTQTISNLRNALDDKAHELVTTIPKKGYCIGIKPIFISSKEKERGGGGRVDCLDVVKNNEYILSGVGFRYKVVLLAVFISCFFTSLYVTLNSHAIKILHPTITPILIGLDDTLDEVFLSTHRKAPYVYLKKTKQGEYIACKYQTGELICERK
ncbi:winged helix-turn-helix domain-containing protein [Yersinia sp. 2542 StPb PI]|uniref:winged helix-turn-helix domain-containing protein n=1 Tax=Yersinia sp. 2542 StPb PI TaxID=3117408 RepID=UPI003B27E07C